MRGENAFDLHHGPARTGTSPRARGKRHQCRVLPSCGRNIPACAGKTISCQLRRLIAQEHPRVRGENSAYRWFSNSPSGTSPRARGKHQLSCLMAADLRNIPACAGKTHTTPYRRREGEEHPRVRGENPTTPLGAIGFAGTSPRARGKRFFVAKMHAFVRNIPACAGKT